MRNLSEAEAERLLKFIEEARTFAFRTVNVADKKAGLDSLEVLAEQELSFGNEFLAARMYQELAHVHKTQDLETLKHFVLSEGYICPQPRVWSRIWLGFVRLHKASNKEDPPREKWPLLLSGWGQASEDDLRQRFLTQLDYIDQCGRIEWAIRQFRKLEPEHWYVGWGGSIHNDS